MLSTDQPYCESFYRAGPNRTPDHHVDVLHRARQWKKALSKPGFRLLLNRSETKTLNDAIGETQRRRYLCVVLPCRAVAQRTGISHKAAYQALDSLVDKGILERRSRGTWRGLRPNHGGLSAIYCLSDPDHPPHPRLRIGEREMWAAEAGPEPCRRPGDARPPTRAARLRTDIQKSPVPLSPQSLCRPDPSNTSTYMFTFLFSTRGTDAPSPPVVTGLLPQSPMSVPPGKPLTGRNHPP
jgi:hypothetical protein